ncbi:DUF4384 domain-containing protein [Rhodobacteraceae bacterium F11138]|nr:DUF4384 domain-containing protein [Rhodobacteraceae bacterium F11138]
MKPRATIWVAGAGGSIMAHLVLFAALSVALRPDPVEQQNMPSSALDVQSYRLNRTPAPERPATPETAKQSAVETKNMAAGSIPQSQAHAAQISDVDLQPLPGDPGPAHPVKGRSQRLDDTRVDAKQLASAGKIPAKQLIAAESTGADLATQSPAAPPVDRVSAQVQAASAIAMPAQTIAPAHSGTPVALAARPQHADKAQTTQAGTTQAPVVAANARPTPTAHAQGPPAARAEAAAVPAALVQAAPRSAARLPHDAQQLTAALAFSGKQDGDIDPTSLAAFQGFVRPDDISGAADGLRDGLAALLAQIPCARLQVGFDPDIATLQVNGHVPQGDLRGPLLSALRDRMGADIAISDKILILPHPQCAALTGIADVGLPQSTDQITNPLLIGADTHARVLDFIKDDRLFFELTAPEYDAYIYVDYFDAGGNVLHLAPNAQTPLRLVAAESPVRIGARTPDEPGLQIAIGPPYGQEIAVAFAASAPLYEGVRPLVESAPAYLDWLKSRVTQARAENPDFKGEWVYFFVTTAEQ